MNRFFARIFVWFHIIVIVFLGLWGSVGSWAAEQQWRATVKLLELELLQTFPPRSADTTAKQVS
ncbi:MAG: hypothetical protein MJA27_23445 [Pseudanabaenales cyanobacterium]|nr:hypothetical protein [Pseudanabaenales cyanobacterium]